VAFLDRSKGLFINALEAFSSGTEQCNASEKLASQIDDFSWNDDREILIAVSEKNLITWFYPRVALFDKDLLLQSTSMKAGIDFAERAKISCFDDSTIEIEFEDGSKIQNAVDQCSLLLHECVHENKWNQAQKICQFMKTKEYWATLASLSLHHGNLNVALNSLCALQAVDKVEYIKHVQNIPTEEVRPGKLRIFKYMTDSWCTIDTFLVALHSYRDDGQNSASTKDDRRRQSRFYYKQALLNSTEPSKFTYIYSGFRTLLT